MWEILDEARNPPGLTMIKVFATLNSFKSIFSAAAWEVKEMLDGTFRAGEQKDACRSVVLYVSDVQNMRFFARSCCWVLMWALS